MVGHIEKLTILMTRRNFLIVYYMWPIYPDDSDLVTFYTM